MYSTPPTPQRDQPPDKPTPLSEILRSFGFGNPYASENEIKRALRRAFEPPDTPRERLRQQTIQRATREDGEG